MPVPNGSPLSDIFDQIPATFRDIVNRFTADGVTSKAFIGGTLHTGIVKSINTDPITLGFGELELPGVNAGIPFRLAVFDSPAGKWHLDLVLDGLSLKLAALQGADFLKETATTPRRLIRKATDTEVVISGTATLRFQRASDGDPVVVLFVDEGSAADPLAQTGAVIDLRCNPPHFFFGSSQFGMSIGELLFDGSDTYSPDYIVKQGQTAEWMGFSIAEATFYAPPNAIGRGGFSGGVRNLLIGSPRGLQGELEVQWGRAPLDPSTFVFKQAGQAAAGATGSGNARLVPITAGQDEPVSMTVAFVASNPPDGNGSTVDDWSATWRWPNGSETNDDTATGTVSHGQILRVRPEEHIAGRPVVKHPEISFRFVASGEAPQIDITVGGAPVANVIHLAGPAADIAALALNATSIAPTAGSFTWKLGTSGVEQTGAGISLPLTELVGDQYLVLREADTGGHARVTRMRVQVAEGQVLLIGTKRGVVAASAPAAPLAPAAVEGTYDLPDFHAQGRYRAAANTAVLDAGAPAKVDVPDGTLAIVTIPSGATPPPVKHDRHVEILFEFATGQALRWGADRPAAVAAAGSEQDLHRQVLQWAANYPGADFLVVGRCDDLGSDQLNATLAHARRDTAVRFLTTILEGGTTAPIGLSRITGAWGEQDGQPPGVASSPLDDEEKDGQRLILATDNATGIPLTDRTNWPPTRKTNDASEPKREAFRRVDIYAVGGTPAAAAVRGVPDPGRAPDLRRMAVPGQAVAPVPAVTTSPAMDYRVKLLVGWAKSNGDGWKDLIPSKAEFEFAWSPEDHPLPTLGGDPVTLSVLTIYGSWSHDDVTGFTRSQLGIRSEGDPEGLAKTEQANLVAALALGPMLLSGVDSSTDTIEKAGRIAALAGAAAFAKVDLGGGPLVGAGSKAIVKTLEANAEIRDGAADGDSYKVSLVGDYTTVLHVNTGRLGLKTAADHPVKFRYKKVGVEFDSGKTNIWDMVGIAYPTDALEIEDPGKWKIDGVLGELLRAVETAMGKGSLWIETRFAFALSIGVVEISEAVIRVTFTGAPFPDFSLRGLVAKIDIPAAVKGEGRLRIEDPGGIIKAGVDLDIIPLKLKASAALALASFKTPEPYTFINLFAKVQFPVGIPLGPSGAALYGFVGQTVINGERDVTPSPDVVTREIGWWGKNPEDKYKPERGQHALGLGAVVGTLPDASFSMSAQGMVVVAFPDPSVIFGVEVKLLSVPDKTAKEKGGDPNASIIGLIVIDDTAVSIAVSAKYEIPKILKVKAPFAAYFPYSGHGIYVRIGCDGQGGRSGEPVTLTLLPGTLDLKAFAYLMIEQDGLPSLGGKPEFSFDGFSIGFGAGAALEWKAGPIRLSASVLLLAGFGTDPLMIKAGIFVKGELDLVVVSVSARGEIILTYQDEKLRLDGEFCGSVDCFFFSVSGCIKFHIGSAPTITAPPPPAPVVSVVLTDRGGRIMGEARGDGGALQALPLFKMTPQPDGSMTNDGADPRDNHTVWADTAPIINFRHFIHDAIPASHQFDPTAQPSAERWFGSNRLKYTYQLEDVRLTRVSDGAVVTGTKALQSTWVTSPARQPGSAGPVLPSGAEVQSLKLLDWQPWGWALPMDDGGASAPGDPATTIENLCKPIPVPPRACLYGRDARAAGPDRILLLHETLPTGPYPSRFTLIGRPALWTTASLIEGAALAAQITGRGGLVFGGAVVTLPAGAAALATGIERGYRLPEAQIATKAAIIRTALPWLAELDLTIRRGQLLLMVCEGRKRGVTAEPHDCYDFDGLRIGARFTTLDVPGYRLEAVDAGSPFAITDKVDLSQGSALLGEDKQSDVLIAAPGLVVMPLSQVRILELHLFRNEPFATAVQWSDESGKNYQLLEEGGAIGSVVVRLEAETAIKQIRIIPRAKTLHLYRICMVGSADEQTCFTFDVLKRADAGRPTIPLEGVTFSVLDPAAALRLSDDVDTDAVPAKRGNDGRPELGFPDKGVEIRPDQPWSSVTIGAMSGGGPLTAIALDANDRIVARVQDDAREPVEMHLSAAAITKVIVTGGNGEGTLFRICHRPIKNDVRLNAIEGDGTPTVLTRIAGEPHEWPSKVRGTVSQADGGICRIVEYAQPEPVRDAGSIEIRSSSGERTTLLSLCGVDSKAEDARTQDQAAQDGLKKDVTEAANDPLAAREILLDPGEDYEIDVDWSWQSWTSNAQGTDAPPPIPTGSWTAGLTQSFRFRIAAEELAKTETQDGLNEFKFDPRDIARYLSRTEPADGRGMVFTRDPLWVHFDTGHVEGLAERYGRELVLVVRRTDPPPQPDDAAMLLATFPKNLGSKWLKSPDSTLPLVERRINAAVAAAPCLPDGPATGGASLGQTFALEKHAMYDFDLVARRKGVPEAQADPVIVNATRFVTSRYADPNELLMGLGFAIDAVSAPFVPQDIILSDAMTLPTGPMSVSDADMGSALNAIGAGTLPLPGDAGRTIALWRHLGGGVYGVAAVLVDAPEPIRRVAAVVQGQQAQDAVRCEPDNLSIGTTVFEVVRATNNWTRVLFVAAKPVTPAAESELQFHLKVSPNGTVTGRRIINARPVLLDTEGF